MALLTLSSQGLSTALRLRKAFPEATVHAHRSVPTTDAIPFRRLADRLAELWPTEPNLVVLAPTGVVVRALAPLLQSKHRDPAVVVCDVLGRWAISLVSGHEGGANALALHVANALDGEPVITTTTEAAKTLIVGLGCRQGTSVEVLERVVHEALDRIGGGLPNVRYLATASIKSHDLGLIQLSERLGIPLRFMGLQRIRSHPFPFSESPAAERHFDVPGVAEPSALLSGTRTQMRLPRTVLHGCTVAIAEEMPCPDM